MAPTLIQAQSWSFDSRVVVKNKLLDGLGTNPKLATYSWCPFKRYLIPLCPSLLLCKIRLVFSVYSLALAVKDHGHLYTLHKFHHHFCLHSRQLSSTTCKMPSC